VLRLLAPLRDELNMWIVFIGPPGAGKGTQSRRLAQTLGIPHLSTGDMLRQAIAEGNPVGKIAQSYMKSGHLVPDPVTIQVLCERLSQADCNSGTLFDGFPRTLGQARALDDYLAKRGEAVDAALDFRVPEDHLVARLANRGRGDDHPDTIRRRFRDFEALTKPLIEYYERRGLLHVINGVGTMDEVFGRIMAALKLDQPPA